MRTYGFFVGGDLMTRIYRIILAILAVVNLALVSLNLLIPLVATPVVGAPTPLQTALIGIYPITNTWPILTGLILLFDVFKPGGGMTGHPGGGTTG
jgi:hypothetical protein